jgi:4-oxalocrotonate tautomerase
MPFIMIEGPPIKDLDLKRRLVKELSEAAVNAYHLPIEKIHVLIRENPPENVGTGGGLLYDKKR